MGLGTFVGTCVAFVSFVAWVMAVCVVFGEKTGQCGEWRCNAPIKQGLFQPSFHLHPMAPPTRPLQSPPNNGPTTATPAATLILTTAGAMLSA
jgi:hypothetical protein